MPEYIYKAIAPNKQVIEGSMNASTPREVEQQLASQNYHVINVRSLDASSGSKIFRSKIPLIEKANLCRYLATMIGAGLSLPEAVAVFAQDTSNPNLKAILSHAETQLQQGKPLSATFAMYPKVFDHIIIALVRAGETSGTLNQSLNYLADYLFSEYKLHQKVKGALMYPIIILIAMSAVMSILIFFVLPKMAPIFLNMRVPLPIYTTVMLKSGLFLSENAFVVLPIVLITLIALGFSLRTPLGKKVGAKLISLIPAMKRLIHYLDIARFCRTLSTLLASGVPITQAITIVASSLSLQSYRMAAEKLAQDIQKGTTMAQSLREYPDLFPQMTVRMIAAGEKTGSIESMLAESADFYEQEIDDILTNFANIIEPILLLAVGIAVGVMVIAIIGPIYSLVGGIQQK